MSFIKILGNTVPLVGKKYYLQIIKNTNVIYSVSPYFNRPITYSASEERRMSNWQKYNRFVSTANSNNGHAAQENAIWSNTRKDFMAMFSDFVRDMTETGKYSDADISEWLDKVLQYNLPGGKLNRGLTTILSYKLLEKPENLTSENLHLVKVMGWCVEVFRTYFQILDDVMDNSETRHRIPCWYKLSGIGLMAINDAALLHASMLSMLKKNFHDKPYYTNMLEIFNEAVLKSVTGMYIEMTSVKKDILDLSKFTMDRYNTIVKYKTTYFAFQFPVSLAMLMCGINDPETHCQSEAIFLRMGEFFQIQDDFLDCFGNPDVTGKVGTDIQEGKCTWLSVVALQRSNPAQKLIMEEYYGSSDLKHVARIKALYEELDIAQIFRTYEETTYNLIRAQIQQIPKGLPHELFLDLLEKFYRRDV